MYRKVIHLGEEVKELRDVWVIYGVGLSSNIYVFAKEPITLIDTGVGNSLNRLSDAFGLVGIDLSQVELVILTHGHFDHVGGVKELLRGGKPRIYIHRFDSWMINFKARELTGGETLSHDLLVIHTPGHTRGSVCLYSEKTGLLISGDTVFSNGMYGRTDLPSGDQREMVESLKKLSSMNISFLLPGHEEIVLKGAWKHVNKAYINALNDLSFI